MRFTKRKFLIAVLCLVAAAALTWRLFDAAESTKDTAHVVRVTERVSRGTKILPEMLHTVEVGAFGLGEGVLFADDGIVGKFASTDIYPDDNLTLEKFVDYDCVTDSFAQKVHDSRLSAVSVELGGISSGFSGKLKVGDVVSAYVFKDNGFIDSGYKDSGFNDNGDTKAETEEARLYPELEFLEIAAITNNRAEDIDSDSAASGSDVAAGVSHSQGDSRIPTAVTFYVNQEQAARLIGAENTGKIHLVFRGRGVYGQELLDNFTT